MRAPSSLRSGRQAAAAPGRKAGGAIARRATLRRRTGGNRHYYPRVSVGLIPVTYHDLSGERVRHD
jgi:hypothetical protein